MQTFIIFTCLLAATLAHSIDTRQTSKGSDLDEANSARVTIYTTQGGQYGLVNARSPIDGQTRLISSLTPTAANHQSNRAGRNSNAGMSCKIYGPSGELLITLKDGQDEKWLSPTQGNYPTDKLSLACMKL